MLEKHQLLKSYSAIWRPHVFNNVIANYTDSAGEKFSVNVGQCYSEFTSGPNMQHLADHVASFTNARWVSLASFEYAGFRIDIIS